MSAVSWADERVAESPQPVLAKRRRSVKQPTCPPNSKPTPAVQVGKESVYEFDEDEAREEPKKKLKKLKEPKVKVVKAAKENLVDKVNKPMVRKGGPRTPVHDNDDDEDEEDEEDTPTLRVRRKGTTPKGMVFKSL